MLISWKPYHCKIGYIIGYDRLATAEAQGLLTRIRSMTFIRSLLVVEKLLVNSLSGESQKRLVVYISAEIFIDSTATAQDKCDSMHTSILFACVDNFFLNWMLGSQSGAMF